MRSNNDLQLNDDGTSLVMATIPVVMRALRTEMRANRPAGISVPQFRTLIFLTRHTGASISDVANHLGLALSTASKLVDGLLKREFVERAVFAGDRRRATLALTTEGTAMLASTRAQAHARMTQWLAMLSPEEEAAVRTAMLALYQIFQTGSAEEGVSRGYCTNG